MELTTIWFVVIAFLWIGYFALEGFDFGVGILLPVLAKDETERRVMINTIGPVWDGNEVWLLVAGGATFAAFPNWYATLFSGFYLPLLLILVGPDRARRRVRVPPPAPRRAVGVALGQGHLLRLARARRAVGRRLRQHRGRGADRRRHGVHRQPVHPAQPVRPARRTGHAAALRHPRRHLHRAQDRRRHPAPGPRARLEERPRRRRARRRLPRLAPGADRQRRLGRASSRSPRCCCSAGSLRRTSVARACPSPAPSARSPSRWRACSSRSSPT